MTLIENRGGGLYSAAALLDGLLMRQKTEAEMRRQR